MDFIPQQTGPVSIGILSVMMPDTLITGKHSEYTSEHFKWTTLTVKIAITFQPFLLVPIFPSHTKIVTRNPKQESHVMDKTCCCKAGYVFIHLVEQLKSKGNMCI